MTTLEVKQPRFPGWLHRPLSRQGQWEESKRTVRAHRLHTVCEEARCPNLGECWSHGNVSFMILGDRCTRACSFCAVTTGRPQAPDPQEPERLASAVGALRLRYVVVTSVARDDLADEGAGAFAASIEAIHARSPGVQVEVLVPDFHAKRPLIRRVVEASPEVLSHNLETVRRLSRSVRPQAGYDRSLQVLQIAGELAGSKTRIKSGLMVGLGERPEEVQEAMRDLRSAGCEILTIGQYLSPTREHPPVADFVRLEQFDLYRRWGESLGFSFVASAPYVRSSYNAFEALRG